MSENAATWIVSLAAAYLAIGVVFAIPFILRGAAALDPDAEKGSVGFRLLILPGSAALWPLLAARWRRGRAPAAPRTPHEKRARLGGER